MSTTSSNKSKSAKTVSGLESIDVVEISDSFTKQVKKLLQIAAVVVSGDATKQALLETAKRQIQLVSREDPFFLLENIGKYLYTYREVIHGDVDDFIANPGKYIRQEEITEINNLKNSVDNGTAGLGTSQASWDAFASCLDLFKDKWNGYDQSEKKVVTKAVQRMLSGYCKYIIHHTP
jgi:hypothetical protein